MFDLKILVKTILYPCVYDFSSKQSLDEVDKMVVELCSIFVEPFEVG